MNKIYQIFSTLFFIGYVKWAPGTIASLASLIIILLLKIIFRQTTFIFLFIFIFFIAIIFVTKFSKSINKHDAKEIVIDEFLGIYIIIIFSYNFDIFDSEYLKFFLIFIFFRIFDIVKPFPIKWIDNKIQNSYGIIFDDIIAGVYTIIILALINVFI